MGKVFKYCAEERGFAFHSLRFLIDGERINPNQSPRDLELEDNDVIDCMLEQCGD